MDAHDTLSHARRYLLMGQRSSADPRSPQQLRDHYEVERRLADRLRQSSEEERQRLYSSVYDELYQRVPHHPQLARKASPGAQREAVASRLSLLRRFLLSSTTFMEIGPGDCSLSLEVAKHVRQVYAVDVSAEITRGLSLPNNFALLLSGGSTIPVPANSIDVAYSFQLIEHLHPSDAAEHFRHVHRALAPGGIYVCVTPNRLNGPHDISKYFDEVATGLHLKEYTTDELVRLFRSSRFSRVRALVGVKGHFLPLPTALIGWLEHTLASLPHAERVRIASWLPLRLLLGITLVAKK